jgi:hypothetical protein
MAFTGKIGDTYIRDDSGGGHPCIILTEPNNDGKIVVVNISELRAYKEQTVTFAPRDDRHFFKKRSTIIYEKAKFVDHGKLVRHIKRNPRKVWPYCQPHIQERVVRGAFLSRNTPGKIIKALRVQYPEEYEMYYEEEPIF